MTDPVPILSLAAVPAGFLLDALIGDPVFRLHPVRVVGHAASFLERATRRVFPPMAAGVITWALLLVFFGAGSVALSLFLSHANPVAGFAFDTFLVWASMARKDLAVHATQVARPLESGNVPEARSAVGMIVGRDTDGLDGPGVARAAVESLAESTIDGIAAPLFWAAIAHPAAGWAFRVANTCDSMFGHKNAAYIKFGFLSAKADDALAFIPARLGGILVCSAGRVMRIFSRGTKAPVSGSGAFAVFFRDRLRHESPNAAHGEAAFAGALGLRLGGAAFYGGERIDHPAIGDGTEMADGETVRSAISLMNAASVLSLWVFSAAGAAIRWSIISLG